MALEHTVYQKPGGTEIVHFVTDQKNVVETLVIGAGTIRSISLIAGNGNADIYVKLWDKETTVTPATDDPDWQFEFPAAPLGELIEFDEQETINAFSEGLQINVSTGKGLNDAAPTTGLKIAVAVDQS